MPAPPIGAGHEGRHIAPSRLARPLVLVLAIVLLAVPAATVIHPFAPESTATPRDGGTSQASGEASAGVESPRSTPTPIARPLHRIAFVAGLDLMSEGSRSDQAWKGVQTAATSLHATATKAVPYGPGDLATLVEAAATDADVVVTSGPESSVALRQAAVRHPAVQFVAVEAQVVAPLPNVQSILFDETEAGYLAGLMAAAFSTSGDAGLAAEGAFGSGNYALGFAAGVEFWRGPTAAVRAHVEWSSDAGDAAGGRAAVDRLRAAGADTIVVDETLAGVGAARAGCASGLRLVGLGSDPSVRLPETRACVVGSVVKRYEVAVAAALARYASGAEMPASVVADVASDGIGVTPRRVPEPPGFAGRLALVLDEMRAGPPRPTAAPAVAPTPAPLASPAGG